MLFRSAVAALIGKSNEPGLFDLFEEREAGAFVFGDLISFGEGVHGSGAGFRGKVVKGDGLAAPQGLLAAVEEVGFSVLLACSAKCHFVYLLGLALGGAVFMTLGPLIALETLFLEFFTEEKV